METHNRKRLMSAAYRYAFSGLALNYYTFYETLAEYPDIAGLILQSESRLAPVLDEFLKDGQDCRDRENLVSALDGLRRQVMKEMEVFTSYQDCFSIYEYVLNRMERRFVKMDPPDQTQEAFIGQVMDSMGTSDSPMLLDSRLRTLVAQLPIRYTRQKFYNMVHDRMNLYTGVERESLENMFYMLETSAMVRLAEGMEEREPRLYEILEILRHADYRKMDAENYAFCRDSLEEGTKLLNKKCDIYLLFEELIDAFYVVLLSRDDAMVDYEEEQAFQKILSGVRALFATGDGQPADETLTESLTDLEGIQESAMERLQFAENEPDRDLRMIEKLLSSSSFVDLEETGSEGTADQAWVDKKTEEFCKRLEDMFSDMQKPVMRAVMAAVLAQLPMMFRSVSEFMEYLEGSLSSCTDFAEKEACMEILKEELDLD